MTMINFRRTGGALSKELSVELDLGTIPDPTAQRLQNHLMEANFFEIPDVSNLLTRPDEYEYSITVVAGNAIRTVHVTDTAMPESLRPLVEDLIQLARAMT